MHVDCFRSHNALLHAQSEINSDGWGFRVANAIETAVDELAAGDVLLIAGKGHEPGQIVGKTVLPFSDHDVAREAIARRTA